jgi:hypothetical protein
VTALERVGKKDPSIRFDVHVCVLKVASGPSTANVHQRQICPNFEPRKSETLSAHIPNLSN